VGLSGLRLGQHATSVDTTPTRTAQRGADDIRDKFLEAKSTGFDVKVMRQVLRLRKKSKAERQEEDSILDVYLHALGMMDDGSRMSAGMPAEMLDAAE
jgi:hypothetical protein